ncbi:YIP1 family protein [Undibacterium flavidum]|uniref:YIP1 family protein n=1 Tax=Undibacterium flavidum TaxID=2762297 RepID=A0ABR6YH20_9BURK|nr:YIP1 family protein [Undibacterium flavidum]MBC3875885.1 YIP1 family protein [Undibacterium flavidum]
MSSNAISVIAKLFFEPKAAYIALKEKPAAWVPLVMIILGSLIVFYWYFATVDLSWLIEHTMASQPNLKPEARTAMASFMTRNAMMYSTLGIVFALSLIIYAVFALYYWLASKVLGTEITYGNWFHFTVWTSVPALLGLPLMAIQVATGHGQVAMEDLNMLSMNYLIAHAPLGAPWERFLTNISITTLWTALLSFVGLRVWTGRSTAACAFAALLPYVFFFGCWALKITFSN